MLNGFRAAQIVCVQVCLTNLHTADTTVMPGASFELWSAFPLDLLAT